MADELPRFIVLKSPKNNNYLIHQRDDQDHLQFIGTDYSSLHAKFEVVKSSKKDGLVHLRCCYNRKYWVCRAPTNTWIRAEAPEMEEDTSKWSCTLFKPVFYNTSNRIGFCHVHINKIVNFHLTSPFRLFVGGGNDSLDFFNWNSLPILPRFIRLKDKEGNYLSACKADQYYDKVSNTFTEILKWVNPIVAGTGALIKYNDDSNVYLCFNCKVKGDQTVGNEVFITPDNKIRLRNNHTGKFWRLSPSWIWPDSEDETNNNPDTLFQVARISHNKIALRNMGNNSYCQRFSADRNKENCLNANSATISEWTTFEVEELIEKRNIFNVRFHEKDARIYEKEIMCKVSSTDLNNTDEAFQAALEYEFTKEESRSWTTSNELKQTAEIEITASVPEVVDGKLKYAREVTQTVTEGKTLNEKIVTKFTRTVTVPPHSKVVATFRVTHALCEVPYSYSQTEISLDGTPSGTYTRDDGLYTSVLTEVHFNPKQEKISS